MAKNKLSRIDLHKKICAFSGVQRRSKLGYLSRVEMMELYDYLCRVNEVCRSLLTTGYANMVKPIIITGKIYNEISSKRN